MKPLEKLSPLLLQLAGLLAQILCGVAKLPFLFLQSGKLSQGRIFLKVFLLQQLLRRLQLLYFLRLGLFRLHRLFLDLVHFHKRLPAPLLKLLHLPLPSQEIAGVFKGTAAHGAARTKQLPLQGHQPQRMAVFPRERDGVIHMIHHQHTAQKVADQSLIFLLGLHQAGSRS